MFGNRSFARRSARSALAATVLAATLSGCAAGPADAQSHGARPSADIVETAVAAGSFGTLAAALEAAGLVETLQGEGPFTVFAPTDEAFAALPGGTVEMLLQPENRSTLVDVLTYHVVAGRVTAEQVVQLDEATTVNGARVEIDAGSMGVRINGVDVVQTDVFASNGVIHVIDEVLLPPALRGQDRDGRRDAGRERMTARTSAAAEILSLAIRRGVPLFNEGAVAGTVGIYEVAARSVLAGDFQLPRAARTALEDGVAQAGRTHDLRDRAWVYRGALDRALDELEGRMALRRPAQDRH